jgi:hypothetical protein
MARRLENAPDDEIARIIKLKARKLNRCPEYWDDDARDIEQDLHLIWLRIRGAHLPSRGSIIAFADVSLNYQIRKQIAARRSHKRSGRQVAGSNSTGGSSGVVPNDSASSYNDESDELGVASHEDSCGLRIDVHRALRKLRPELQRIALMLAENDVTQISETVRLSRPTVYARIAEIRQSFEDNGLKGYWS